MAEVRPLIYEIYKTFFARPFTRSSRRCIIKGTNFTGGTVLGIGGLTLVWG